MTFRIALATLLFLPALSHAQLIPALHPFSGLSAASSTGRIERSGLPISGPRFEATGMPAAPAQLFQRVKPTYRLTQTDLGIPDVLDVVFFGETRLARIRLNVKIVGEPLTKSWITQMKRYFDFLDRDGDGCLNAFEAEFVFSKRAVQQLFSTGQSFSNLYEPGRALTDFDRDADGRISFDEFIAYYATTAHGMMRVQTNDSRDDKAQTLTDELFKLLDRDKDGQLSQAELAEADKLLPLLDQNEDECLTALEIVPNLNSRQAPPTKDLVKSAAHPNSRLQFFPSGTLNNSIVEQILLRYDKDKNLRLDKSESGLDETTFAVLDKNGDGELTIPELLAWKDLPPDLDVELNYSSNRADCKLKVRSGPDGKPSSLAGAVRLVGDNKAFVRVGRQQIDLGVMGDVTLDAPTPAFDYFDLFKKADRDNKGYFTEKDIVGPQYQLQRILFDIVDRDGDGKVTRKEFSDYFELQHSFAGLPLAVAHLTLTPSLFALIDANSDGRLCVRELRNAWSRLKTLEPGDGAFITRAALQPQATIRLVPARIASGAFAAANYNPNVQPTTKGPLWFRKMDRNNDGDISRSEFPGAPQDFDKLDLDHDGLISVEEAEAADKLYRAPADKK